MTNQDGQPFTAANLAGKHALLVFGDASLHGTDASSVASVARWACRPPQAMWLGASRAWLYCHLHHLGLQPLDWLSAS